MSARCNGRASCVGSYKAEKKPFSSSTKIQKQKSRKQEDVDEDDDAMKFTTTCNFRMPRKRDLTPLRYLKHLGDKMVGVIKMISPRRPRASPKVNSSERAAKPCVAPLDSHRAEAIDDCIEFINSSSSLPRSNSSTH